MSLSTSDGSVFEASRDIQWVPPQTHKNLRKRLNGLYSNALSYLEDQLQAAKQLERQLRADKRSLGEQLAAANWQRTEVRTKCREQAEELDAMQVDLDRLNSGRENLLRELAKARVQNARLLAHRHFFNTEQLKQIQGNAKPPRPTSAAVTQEVPAVSAKATLQQKRDWIELVARVRVAEKENTELERLLAAAHEHALEMKGQLQLAWTTSAAPSLASEDASLAALPTMQPLRRSMVPGSSQTSWGLWGPASPAVLTAAPLTAAPLIAAPLRCRTELHSIDTSPCVSTSTSMVDASAGPDEELAGDGETGSIQRKGVVGSGDRSEPSTDQDEEKELEEEVEDVEDSGRKWPRLDDLPSQFKHGQVTIAQLKLKVKKAYQHLDRHKEDEQDLQKWIKDLEDKVIECLDSCSSPHPSPAPVVRRGSAPPALGRRPTAAPSSIGENTDAGARADKPPMPTRAAPRRSSLPCMASLPEAALPVPASTTSPAGAGAKDHSKLVNTSAALLDGGIMSPRLIKSIAQSLCPSPPATSLFCPSPVDIEVQLQKAPQPFGMFSCLSPSAR